MFIIRSFTAVSLLSLVAVAACGETDSSERADESEAALTCTGAKRDDNGICRLPDGKFAEKKCCTPTEAECRAWDDWAFDACLSDDHEWQNIDEACLSSDGAPPGASASAGKACCEASLAYIWCQPTTAECDALDLTFEKNCEDSVLANMTDACFVGAPGSAGFDIAEKCCELTEQGYSWCHDQPSGGELTCEGRCGSPYEAERVCQCDAACAQFDDCCPDLDEHCGG